MTDAGNLEQTRRRIHAYERAVSWLGRAMGVTLWARVSFAPPVLKDASGSHGGSQRKRRRSVLSASHLQLCRTPRRPATTVKQECVLVLQQLARVCASPGGATLVAQAATTLLQRPQACANLDGVSACVLRA